MLSINLYQRKQCWNKFALSCSKNISVVKSKFTIRFHGPFDKVRITSSRNTVRKKKHLKTGNVPNFKADWIKINENLVLKIGETKEDGGGGTHLPPSKISNFAILCGHVVFRFHHTSNKLSQTVDDEAIYNAVPINLSILVSECN